LDGLIVLGLIDGSVDFGEDEISVDVLALLEVHAHQLAVDLSAHRHGIERAARTDAVEIHRNVGLLRGCREHWYGSVAARPSPSAAPAGLSGLNRRVLSQILGQVLRRIVPDVAGRDGKNERHTDNATPPPPRHSARIRHGRERLFDPVGFHPRPSPLTRGDLFSPKCQGVGSNSLSLAYPTQVYPVPGTMSFVRRRPQ